MKKIVWNLVLMSVILFCIRGQFMIYRHVKSGGKCAASSAAEKTERVNNE